MKIDAKFQATMQKSPSKGGWTYVVWPESQGYFKTAGLVKVKGLIDGKPFRASFMAMGNGQQMLPIKRETRELLGKDVGDTVSIELHERLD